MLTISAFPEPSNSVRRSPPRVLFVIIRPEDQSVIGGAEISAIQVAVHLRARGIDIETLERAPHVQFDYGMTMAYSLKTPRGYLNARYVMEVVRMAITTKCDIIYAYADYFQETIVPSFIAALVARKRLFVDVLDDLHRTEDERPFYRLMINRVGKRPGIRSLLEYAVFHASRRLAIRTGTCLAASRFTANYAIQTLHARRAYVVGRGVERQWFNESSVRKTYDGVYLGRFDRFKRVSVLVTAWKIVVMRKRDAKLLLIGDSGGELSEVRRLVENLGLSDNVTFEGFVGDRSALVDKVKSARVFIFPSKKEGFGLAPAEAMASGLPCVLSDIAPLREVFGDSAIFAKVDEPTSFANAILDLLLDHEKQLIYSVRSKELAKEFRWEKVAKNVQEAMKSQVP